MRIGHYFPGDGMCVCVCVVGGGGGGGGGAGEQFPLKLLLGFEASESCCEEC